MPIIPTKKIMESIKNFRYVQVLFIAVVFLALGSGLYAQSAGLLPTPRGSGQPGQLNEEIQNLEQILSGTGISSAEKYDALTRLARLRHLSGDISGAAANWLEAAVTLPGDNGDDALVAAVYCLAAVGEWEKAASILQPLIGSNMRGTTLFQIRYLDAFMKAWNGDISALVALADDPEFAGMRPTIYYTLWRTLAGSPNTGTENAEIWKDRLLAEFPNSLEARMVNYANSTPSVGAVQRPLWLLLPNRNTPVTPGSPPVPQPAEQPPVAPVPAIPAPQNTSIGSVLQAGLFSTESNARSRAEQLQKAGFTAMISRKMVNYLEHWAVIVPAGQDPNKTALDLKRAGFDCFLVREN